MIEGVGMIMKTNAPIGQIIRGLREDLDLTQADVAAFLKTTPQYYGKYESGEREIPITRAIELSSFFDVSMDYLTGLSKIKKPYTSVICDEYELELLSSYRALSVRNKGRVDQFISQLASHEKNINHM